MQLTNFAPRFTQTLPKQFTAPSKLKAESVNDDEEESIQPNSPLNDVGHTRLRNYTPGSIDESTDNEDTKRRTVDKFVKSGKVVSLF